MFVDLVDFPNQNHDINSLCNLITNSNNFAQAVLEKINTLCIHLPKKNIIMHSINNNG